MYTPSGSLSRFLATVTARSQYRRLETSSFQPAVPGDREGEGVRTETSRETIRPSITLTWATGLATTAQYSRLRSDVVTSGNRTRTDESSWGGTVNFSVSSPAWIARLPSDVRTSLGWNQSDVFVCLQRVGGESCLPISDSRRQQLDVRVDTAFPPNLRGGASLSYVLNELRHVSSRFSQVIFTVFLDINFLASQIR